MSKAIQEIAGGRLLPIAFHSSLSREHLDRFFRVLDEGIAVNSHAGLLKWLQGEIQHYLPHEIMLAIWREGDEDPLRHDLVSALPGVRTAHLQSEDLLALQQTLYECWVGAGKKPFKLNLGERGNLCADFLESLRTFGKALHGMQSLLVHGISDERTGQDCLYVIFSATSSFNNSSLSAMENLLPYLDIALRRMTPFARLEPPDVLPTSVPYGLSVREFEIISWVKMGKTNAEIASILEISCYTVKNHMQNIFRKLGAYNRLQAVVKLGSFLS
ncbi:MAG: XrtB/PEP-CTERM-associated transcriptional regulator EpsA [Nitrosospira sp.]